MGKTKIEWTERTWNPFRGCTRVSEGCRNCYAERIAARFAKDESNPYFGISRFIETKDGSKDARWTGEVRIIEKLMDAPLNIKKPSLIFLNSMSDTFHESVPNFAIHRLFEVMVAAEQHHFQVLTKHPERLVKLWCGGYLPYGDNIWLGTSIEDVKSVERLEWLKQVDSRVRWVSAEPLLEDITEAIKPYLHYIDWLVVGGESGPKARPMQPEWAWDLYRACARYPTRYFFKQMGGRKDKGAKTLRNPKYPESLPITNQYPHEWEF